MDDAKTPSSRATDHPGSFLDAHRQRATQDVFGIADLATELGTTHRAIRFYEDKGLLSPKRVGTTRVYGRRERARLILILRGKRLGMSLDDIREYLDLYGEHGEGRVKQLARVVERSSQFIDELEERKQHLEQTLTEVRFIRDVSQKKLDQLARTKPTDRTG